MDLEGPRLWIWKDFDGFEGSQAFDLEGFLYIRRVPGIGFGRISMDHTPHICQYQSLKSQDINSLKKSILGGVL